MKLPKKELSRTYELTFLLPHSYTSAEVQAEEKAIQDLIKKHKLKLESQEEWGVHNTQYTIIHAGARHNKALYKHWIISGEPQALTAFEKGLRLNQNILRTLLVTASDEQSGFTQQETQA